MRFALGLEYDGSAFAGWQTQPDAAQVATVQDALETALSAIAAHPVALVCSGRTDAGVHAVQQVAHFDTTAVRPLQAWTRGLNSMLPKTIAVRWVQTVTDDFHARHSAVQRRYTYVLCTDAVRPSLLRSRVGWVHRALKLTDMQAAANTLLGEHDFSSFRASECQAKTPVRTITELAITQQGKMFFFNFQANAFLHHMIRNIVGALVYVGHGRWDQAEFTRVFATKDRKQAAPTFWPDGLYYCGAVYPDHFGVRAPIMLGSQQGWPWGLA